MKMQESAEMYLETILVLTKRNQNVRSVDIACELDYKKPSVSAAKEDACRMEHVISKDSFDAIKKHLDSMNKS